MEDRLRGDSGLEGLDARRQLPMQGGRNHVVSYRAENDAKQTSPSGARLPTCDQGHKNRNRFPQIAALLKKFHLYQLDSHFRESTDPSTMFIPMKEKFGIQLALGLGLLPFCCATVAAQTTTSDASLSAEFVWLLGAAVLGFSVVARRSLHLHINRESTSDTSSRSRKQEHGPASAPHLRPMPSAHERSRYERSFKPILDLIAGLVLSMITLPMVAIITVAIWATLGRPAILKQARVGQFGNEFTMYKFRTMKDDRRVYAHSIEYGDRRVNHKSTDDPRHTGLGRILRKWKLDEIPQFWNVAAGEMSLVGPRPEFPKIVARYKPWQHRRHKVKPGLTGLWQVSARGDAPVHKASDIDVAYVEDVTLGHDLTILLRTPRAVFRSQQG